MGLLRLGDGGGVFRRIPTIESIFFVQPNAKPQEADSCPRLLQFIRQPVALVGGIKQGGEGVAHGGNAVRSGRIETAVSAVVDGTAVVNVSNRNDVPAVGPFRGFCCPRMYAVVGEPLAQFLARLLRQGSHSGTSVHS